VTLWDSRFWDLDRRGCYIQKLCGRWSASPLDSHIPVSFSFPNLCKESAHLPSKVRSLLSVDHRLRCRWNSGDMLLRMLSFSTVAAQVCFQVIIISKFVLIRSLAVFDEGFLDFNRVLVTSLIKLLIGSSWLRFIFENSLTKAFALRSGGGGNCY